MQPSIQPSVQPSVQPSFQPSSQQYCQPSSQPFDAQVAAAESVEKTVKSSGAPPTWIEKVFGETEHCDDVRSQITVVFALAVACIYFVQGSMEIGQLSIRLYLMQQGQTASEISITTGLLSWPWIPKVLYGFVSDTFAICGYHRKPYLVIVGLLGAVCLVVSAFEDNLDLLKVMFITVWFTVAVADVITDALVVEKSEGKNTAIATNLQCFSWGSRAVGGLVSSFGGGVLIDHIGPQRMFGVLAFFPFCIFLAGCGFKERKVPRELEHGEGEANVWGDVKLKIGLLWRTLTTRKVLCPTLFIFFLSSTPSSSQAVEYFFVHELKFNATFLGIVGGVSSIAFLIAVTLYQRFLRNCALRKMLFWSTIAAFLVGSTQLLLVTRLNVKIGIPDQAFAMSDTFILRFTGVFQFLAVLVLCAQICPEGIEGTLFAVLMGILNAAGSVSDFVSAALTNYFGVSCVKVAEAGRRLTTKPSVIKDQYECHFENLWKLVLVAQLSTLLPLLLLWMIPSGTHAEPVENTGDIPNAGSGPQSQKSRLSSEKSPDSVSNLVEPNTSETDLAPARGRKRLRRTESSQKRFKHAKRSFKLALTDIKYEHGKTIQASRKDRHQHTRSTSMLVGNQMISKDNNSSFELPLSAPQPRHTSGWLSRLVDQLSPVSGLTTPGAVFTNATPTGINPDKNMRHEPKLEMYSGKEASEITDLSSANKQLQIASPASPDSESFLANTTIVIDPVSPQGLPSRKNNETNNQDSQQELTPADLQAIAAVKNIIGVDTTKVLPMLSSAQGSESCLDGKTSRTTSLVRYGIICDPDPSEAEESSSGDEPFPDHLDCIRQPTHAASSNRTQRLSLDLERISFPLVDVVIAPASTLDVIYATREVDTDVSPYNSRSNSVSSQELRAVALHHMFH